MVRAPLKEECVFFSQLFDDEFARVLRIKEEFIHREWTRINLDDLQRVVSKACAFSPDKCVDPERVGL